MPEPEFVHCRCDQAGRPLWSFCDDDLFCPQCGQRIAQLYCASQLPQDDPEAPVWVYPQKNVKFPVRQYVFPLTLRYADHFRRRRERPPQVDFSRSSGPTSGWFENRLERLPHDKGHHLTCRLVRKDESRPGESSANVLELPGDGVETPIELWGDFGRQSFKLKICNTPEVVVELQGRGIENVPDNVDERWEITVQGLLTAELILRAVTAPVYIVEELKEIETSDPDVTVQLLQPLPAGTIITPKQPWCAKVRIDTQRFGTTGQQCQLLIGLSTAISRMAPLILTLEKVEKGRLEFWPNPLTVDIMYIGERRSNAPHKNYEGPDQPPVIRKLYLCNEGDETIRLGPPQAQPAEDYGVDHWISVAWATDRDPESCGAGEDGVLELDPKQQAEIEVTVDLSGFLGRPLPQDHSLCATIGSTDQRDTPWSVEFRLNDVQPCRPSPHPLAIDFGNSHSYAAIKHPGEPFPLRDAVVPAHELREPETFPTALFFRDLSDPHCPEYEIGRVAVELGRAAPHALVSDLKRWIGVCDKSPYRTVSDAGGERTHRFHVETLIQLYLKGLIRRTEAILRKHHINHIGVSYPSRFSPERREAFQRIVKQLCEQSHGDPQLHPLTPVELDVDEANAVAISFVFEKHVQQQDLPRVVSQERPSFVVASFDLGGGSLDTALLQFEVEDGDLLLPVFHSQYLGIGGNESFGGDNVTIAVMEILKQRLRNKLAAAGGAAQRLLDRIPHPDQKDHVAKELHLNYQALWTAAEEIKLFQSRRAGGGAEPKADERLKNILQMQLIHGLSLDPVQDAPLRDLLQQGIEAGDFLVDLEDAYLHPVEHDMLGEGGYTVRDRIIHVIEELCRFAECKGVDIQFAVLGGSGCRLPLVEQLFREKLPHTRVVYAPDRIKFRVAFGLARYLDVQQSGGGSHTFVRSRDYTSAAIGLRIPGTDEFIPIVPNCSPVDAPQTWYKFEWRCQVLPLVKLIGKKPLLVLHRQDREQHTKPLGWFDLSDAPQPVPAIEPLSTETLPQPLPSESRAEIRLVGAETEIQLRIHVGGKHYGVWRMLPGTPAE